MRSGDKKRERDFQRDLIQELRNRFKGCIIMKNDASRQQGIPDLLILHKDKWAALECKRSAKDAEADRANILQQSYHVERMNEMSFARFIFPENRQEVLNDLQQALES